MRTSSQLSKTDQCEHHPHSNITQATDTILRAVAQRQVLMRILRGEPITDIKGEIESILLFRGYQWENTEQKAVNLAIYAARINKFAAWVKSFEDQVEFVSPGTDTTIDFFGEEVSAKPDFFLHDASAHKTYITKIKTGRFSNEAADLEENETYALGLCGEKLFPDDEIIVRYCHLGDRNAKEERTNFSMPYDDARAQKIAEINFNDETKRFFTEKHESEKNVVCDPAECAGCAMNNVCHFEEPPISIDIQKEVKPVSEIRLTRAQTDVIEYDRGTARINAGAGAGKTLVVAMRIAKLLEKGANPEEICLLTFTKAGAEEMTARTIAYAAEKANLVDPDKLKSSTFNGFCMDLIKAHYEELGYTAPMRVIPDEVRSGIINRIIEQFEHVEEWNYGSITKSKSYQYSHSLSALTEAKRIFAEIKKEGYTLDSNPYRFKQESMYKIFQMYNEYDRQLHSRNMLEFDDQIIETFRLFDIHPNLAEEIGYKHIVVDEFQDTDLPQINLLNKLIDQSKFESFMAVGDDSQSIFSFRHTSPEYMINFGDYFGRFDDFSLVENHRSNKLTIDFANKVNELSRTRVEKDLIATRPNGKKPVISGFYSQKQEYEWIAKCIENKLMTGVTPSNIAFLASDKNELTAMASILTSMGIPSVLMNPIPFVSNSRVNALCTFYESFRDGTRMGFLDYKNVIMHGALKGADATEIDTLLSDFSDEVKAVKVNGKQGIKAFIEYSNKLDEEKTDECFQDFLEKVGYCEDMNDLDEFFRDFKRYGQDSCFKREGKYEGVCLTTIHSAKGLEWDITYLTLSHLDRREYHTRSANFINSGLSDEVIRKLFVGATRAREELIISGQYVLSMDPRSNACILNDYVSQCFDLLHEANTYNAGEYWRQIVKEKTEAIAQTDEKLKLSGIRKMSSLNIKGTITNQKAEIAQNMNSRQMNIPYILQANRKQQEIAAQKAAEAQAHQQMEMEKNGHSTKSKSRQMTPDERQEYDKMTANCQQISLDEYIKKNKPELKRPNIIVPSMNRTNMQESKIESEIDDIEFS